MNSKTVRRAGAAGAAFVTVPVVGAFATAAPAFATYPGSGNTCNSGAYSPVPSVNYPGGTVSLFFSPSCRTVWAKLSNVQYSQCAPGGTPSFDFYVHRTSDNAESEGCAEGTVTQMLYDAGTTSYAYVNRGGTIYKTKSY